MSKPLNWHEDDAFWEAAEPFMFDDLRVHSALPEIEAVIALTGLKPGSSVLDLCCGPGRHSIQLAKKGMKVTGVDRTATYLDRARRAAGLLDIEWIQDDARQFCTPETFDLVVNLNTSFGYFESQEDDLLVARNIFASLKRGSKLVMQTQGKEVVGSKLVERTWEERGGVTLLQETRLGSNFSFIENRWTLLRGAEKSEIAFVVRLYAASELEALLQEAGFGRVRFFGALTGEPYDHRARHIVAVAEKP